MTKEYLEHSIRQHMIFIETSGKHITGLKNIMALIDSYSSQEKEKEAIEFNKWCDMNMWTWSEQYNCHYNTINIHVAVNLNRTKTSKQLYELYKEKQNDI